MDLILNGSAAVHILLAVFFAFHPVFSTFYPSKHTICKILICIEFNQRQKGRTDEGESQFQVK
jgi:hypothetical protein